jgi:fatty acid-binding protein DegV
VRTARRRVAVVTDSTAALPAGAAERWGVAVVPLDVVVDGQRFTEGVSLTPAALVEALRRGAKVSTSQPAPEAFERAYARAAAAGAEAVVSVHLSGELSGTVAAAHSAAERAPLPVHVVDSRTAAMALGSAALAAAWTAAGVPADERLVVPPPAAAARPTPPGRGRAAGRGATPGASRDEDEAAAGDLEPAGRRGVLDRADHADDLSGRHGLLDRAGDIEPGGRRALLDRADLRHLQEVLHLPDPRHLPEALHLPSALHLPGAWHRPGTPRPADLPGPDEVAAAARVAAAAARVWFLVDSLEHLRRGGRLSGPAAALGTVLGLRPLLTVADGRVVVAEKVRTRRAARARLETVAVAAAEPHERVRVVVHHLGEPEVAAELAARIAAGIGPRACEAVVSDAGAVLGAHVGPGLLAVVVAPA